MAREPKAVAPDSMPEESIGASAPALGSKPAKAASKASQVLEMLQAPAGATIAQMVAATGWLPHTTRAVLTGFKKKGHAITSDKVDGARTYRIAETRSDPATLPNDAQPALGA